MAYDALAKYIPQIAQGTEERTKKRAEVVDHITKLLSDRTPTPVEVASIAKQTLTPYTRREIAAGVRRPTYHEAQAAARAATLKYDVDLLNIIDKGLDGAARDAQILVNAINAQASTGNTTAKNVSTVLKSATQGMSTPEQILFTNEYMSQLGELGPDIPEAEYWRLAARTQTKINPRGKIGIKKHTFPVGDDGLTTILVDDETGEVLQQIDAKRYKATQGGGGKKPILRSFSNEYESGYAIVDEGDPTQYEKVVVSEKKTREREKASKALEASKSDINDALGMLEFDPKVAGAKGVITRATEWVQGNIDPDKKLPATEFSNIIERIKAQNWREILQDTRLSDQDAKRLDTIISGTTWYSTPQEAKKSLLWLRDLLDRSTTKKDRTEKPQSIEKPQSTNKPRYGDIIDDYQYLGGPEDDPGDPRFWKYIR